MPTKDRNSGVKRLKAFLGVLLYSGLVSLVWALAWHVLASAPEAKGLDGKMLSLADRTTIGLSSLAISLGLISVVVGAIAAVGWETIKNSIRRDIEASTKERLATMEAELRGRSFAILGYTMGETSISPDHKTAINPERLKEALFYCQQGYDRLRKAGASAGEFMSLNNLLTYSCIVGDKSRRGYLLEGARRLRAAGEEHDVPNLQLTYARTVLTLGLDPDERKDACAVVEAVLANPKRLNDKEKREADYLASLCERPGPESPGRTTV